MESGNGFSEFIEFANSLKKFAKIATQTLISILVTKSSEEIKEIVAVMNNEELDYLSRELNLSSDEYKIGQVIDEVQEQRARICLN